MAILTKAQLQADNSASFADNNTQAITPQILRAYNGNIIDTLVDSLVTGSFANTAVSNDFTAANQFTSISASSFVSASAFVGDGSKITGVTASISMPISEEGVLLGNATQLNFSGSNITAVLNAGIATISVTVNNLVTTSSFNAFTASTNTFTASVDTKFTAVGSSTASLNSFTSSQNTKNSTLATYTASVDNSISALNQFTASQSTSSIVTSITELNSFTSSQDTKNTTLASYTGSNDTKWSNLGSQSGSFITESETGSFARTNVGNNFTGSNTFVAGYNTEFDGNVYIGQNQNIINGNASNLTISSTSTNGLFLTSPNSNITLTALGQIIPKSFISSSLAITASFFVGDGSQLTNLPTTPPLTSLNSFTASQLTINSAIGASTSSLNTFSASALISINALNTFTASQSTASLVTSITNLNTFTSSQLTINSAIGASTSSLNTFSSSVLTQLNTLANVTSSLISKTGSYATTGSNTFIGDQTITGNITAFSASFTYLQTIFESSSVIYSSGSNQFGDELSDTQTLSGSVKVQGSLTINGTPVQTSSVDISGLTTTASFNAYTSSNDQKVNSLIAATGSYATTGSNTFTGNQTISSSLFISGNINMVNGSDLVTHHVKAAGSNGLELQTSAGTIIVAMGQGGGTQAGFVGAVTANSISASTINGLGDPLAFSTSVDSRLDSLEGVSGSFTTTASFNSYTSSNDAKVNSLISATGSYATTGSNSFNGNQLVKNGAIQAASYNETSSQFYGPVVFQGVGTASVAYDHFVNAGNFDSLHIESNLNAGTIFQDYDGSNVNTWLSIPTNTGSNPSPVMTRGLQVTGSTQVQNFTASLQQGFTYVGNASGITTTVATSSFGTPIPTGTISGSSQITALGFVSSSVTASSLITASVNLNTITFTKGDASTFAITVNTGSGGGGSTDTGSLMRTGSVAGNVLTFTKGDATTFTLTVATGSGGGGAAFPYTGDAVITGSLGVSGSIFGGVIPITVASSTASIDFSKGNMFTLTLPSASTHIVPTNIRAGQTCNIQITQPTPGTGSVTFSPLVLFAGGNDYQATATGSAVDMLTLVSFNGTNTIAAGIKNLL